LRRRPLRSARRRVLNRFAADVDAAILIIMTKRGGDEGRSTRIEGKTRIEMRRRRGARLAPDKDKNRAIGTEKKRLTAA